MSNKYLIVKGCAGLGNRLITLANALEYTLKTNRTIYVDWADGQFGFKGNNIFYKYFQIINVPFITHIEAIENFKDKTCYPPIWGGNNSQKSLYDLYVQDNSKYLSILIPSSITGNISKLNGYWRLKGNKITKVGSDWQAFKTLFNKNDIPYGGNLKSNRKEDIVFFADFCPSFNNIFIQNNIRLTDYIEKELEQKIIELNLDKNTIGVHVRMTDKRPVSNLETLISKIKNINLFEPKIFLSTDNNEVEEYFLNALPNVIFLKKWRPSPTKQQIGIHQYAIRAQKYENAEVILKESILDLWLLSKCNFLIYQKNSSFSRVAAILKNEPEKTFKW